MSRSVGEEAQSFGGQWTRDKLRILAGYLDAYTTALKKQRSFKLIYVDAFAGSGFVDVDDQPDMDAAALLQGSPQIALDVTDRPFDECIFIDTGTGNVQSLKFEIERRGNAGQARVEQGDANQRLAEFAATMQPADRAVVFLDPFGAQVSWQTVRALAETMQCDVWILFPSGTIRRLLPREGDVRRDAHAETLTRVFGDESWRELQQRSQQRNMFAQEPRIETARGTEELVAKYLEKLDGVFAGVAPHSRTLMNSRNVPLYELMFAAGNPAGAKIAVRIADHLLIRW